MLWPYSSLFLLFALLASCAIVGRALAQMLSFRWRGLALFYLSPVLGISVLLLVSVLFGWTYGRYSSWIARGLFFCIILAALVLQRGRKDLPRYLGFLFLFSVIASWPMFIQLWRFGTYQPFNDLITYLAHAQWLQTHSFRHVPQASDFHPIWSQVLLYQAHSLRMGASFFFGWVQGVFGAPWSYEVYPAFMGLAETAAALVLSGAVKAATRARHSTALLIGLCLPLTLNGFAFGVSNGFTPQTYGLVLAIAGLFLVGLTLEESCREKPSPRSFFTACLSGMVLAGLIHTYPENGAFVATGCGLACVFACLVCRRNWRRIVQAAVVIGISSMVLVNLEWVRVYKSLVMESGAVTGWAVPWTILGFWQHSVGWHSASGDGERGLTNWPGVDISVAVLLIVVAAFGIVVSARRKSSRLVAAPFIATFAFLAAGFLYYRYCVPSPFPEPGVGMSWSEYKISQHSGIASFLIIGCGLGYSSRRSRWGFRLVTVCLVFTLITSFYVTYANADDRTRSIRDATQSNTAPFSVYLALRNAIGRNVKPNEKIYLDFQGAEAKSRQIVAYFLNEWPLTSDWTDDGYIFHWISPSNRKTELTSSDWLVSSHLKPRNGSENLLPWHLFRRSDGGIELRAVERGYAREENASSWWYWTDHEILFTFAVLGSDESSFHVKVQTQYTPANADTPVTCRIVGQGVDQTETIMMQVPGTFESQPFAPGPGPLTIHFSTNRLPSKFPPDPRPLNFLIRELKLIRE